MLTDMALRRAKAQEKAYLLTDERGLYVEVRPTGRKFWRLRIWEKGKEKKKTLGEYPNVSLAEARVMRDKLKGGALADTDIDVSFKQVALEWIKNKVQGIQTDKNAKLVESRLSQWAFPVIGDKPMVQITPRDVLDVLRPIEAEEKLETARRVRQIIGQVFRYGVITGQCERDITHDLQGAIRPPKVTHMPTLTSPEQIGGLLRAIDTLKGQIKYTVLFQIYTAVRPGELRLAEWAEIEGDLWRIPGERMKMRRPHWVPLSKQAVEVIEKLRVISGRSKYLFPAVRDKKRPMSDMTVNAAIRRLGYRKDELTGHGFRSMFSTVANENNWPPDIIERQLAHVDKNTVRAAYNHAEYMPQRRELLQWWGDWLDEQRG
ncbi:tyrosine-type recombinase/integrase [Dethiosulfovibrio salsuginis]|uniref:Integrase n=1 Tax=Dethiosulfovibrio salsuginis TaxID=561720 RepID=A0A1X7KJ21_9BACT|nr:tyrosine-type recombinase/integrase [Dethiosulfovibrio salsuginis]SMG40618.1 Integrase [Dethiosulfovibrio salsuginis]